VIAQVESTPTPEVAWFALVPILALVGGALVLLTLTALTARRLPKGTYAVVAVVSALVAIVDCAFLWRSVAEDGPQSVVADALSLDGFSVFMIVVIASAIALASLLADDFVRRQGTEGPELFVLLLLSGAGGVVMAMANDLVVLFLGLETLSIALYVLAGFDVRRARSREAGMKYFVLGAFSSAFLLYGIALVYGATGSTNLFEIADFLAGNVLKEDGLLLAGFALLLVGLGFKISAVPFHVWTPDVYQGAPTPVTAFMASASKAAAFAALLRVFVTTFGQYQMDWQPLIGAIAVLTLLVGSVLGIVQRDVKRMMAYSSINHAGFILVAVQVSSAQGTSAALFYLAAYTFLIVGTFGVMTVIGGRGDAAHSIDDYRRLGARRPGLALAFTVFLLAQAGVPLTSGFLAKFYVINAAVADKSYILAVVAMLSAVISAFLYLRIVAAMYLSSPEDEAVVSEARTGRRVPIGATLALGVALAFTVIVGFLPDQVVEWSRDAVPVLTSSAEG
jgi:NADH-quinone oxidoreductase subunit N